MPYQIPITDFDFYYTNVTASTTPGTSVTPGVNSAEGSWTQVASGASISKDVLYHRWLISGGSTSGSPKAHLMDIGVDQAGGTSYTSIIDNIVCGASAAAASGGRWFHYPMWIKSGSSVAVRIQGSGNTAGTVRVGAYFYGGASYPEAFKVGTISEQVGAVGTNSKGVSFTPGNATDGSWALLGTTTRALWWWQVGTHIYNGTMSAHATLVDLAYGNGVNYEIILSRAFMFMATTETISSELQYPVYARVPAGSGIYIRGNNSAAPVTGYNAIATGVGG